MKNVKQFVLNVKRATGNLKDAVAEAEAKAQKGKNSSKSVKPGTYPLCVSSPFFSPSWFLASSPPCLLISELLDVTVYVFFRSPHPPILSSFLINRSTCRNSPIFAHDCFHSVPGR